MDRRVFVVVSDHKLGRNSRSAKMGLGCGKLATDCYGFCFYSFWRILSAIRATFCDFGFYGIFASLDKSLFSSDESEIGDCLIFLQITPKFEKRKLNSIKQEICPRNTQNIRKKELVFCFIFVYFVYFVGKNSYLVFNLRLLSREIKFG